MQERTFILVLDDGEEAFEEIAHFGERHSIGGASISTIGASGGEPSVKPGKGSSPPK